MCINQYVSQSKSMAEHTWTVMLFEIMLLIGDKLGIEDRLNHNNNI